jgi:hypothetical protein
MLTGSNREESFGANPREAQAFIDSVRKRSAIWPTTS